MPVYSPHPGVACSVKGTIRIQQHCCNLAKLSPAHLSVEHAAWRSCPRNSIAREAQHNGVGPALRDTVAMRARTHARTYTHN